MTIMTGTNGRNEQNEDRMKYSTFCSMTAQLEDCQKDKYENRLYKPMSILKANVFQCCLKEFHVIWSKF